jgi:hypothetical protein
MTTKESSASLVMERCEILGSYSQEPHCLTRPFALKCEITNEATQFA